MKRVVDVFSLDWQWLNMVSNIALITNIILAVFIVIFENKKATSVWAWLMVLFFLPIVGFLHAKSIVIDDKVSSIGTANVDMRSAELNFEINTFIYHEEFAEEMKKTFHKDMESSTEMTEEMYENRSYYKRVKESVSRLLSPLL